MGLFFVSKREYQRVLDEQDRLRRMLTCEEQDCSTAEAKLGRLTRAIIEARESLERAVPVEVVHTWKAK